MTPTHPTSKSIQQTDSRISKSVSIQKQPQQQKNNHNQKQGPTQVTQVTQAVTQKPSGRAATKKPLEHGSVVQLFQVQESNKNKKDMTMDFINIKNKNYININYKTLLIILSKVSKSLILSIIQFP